MNEPARSEALDARAWWTLAAVVAVVLIAYLGLSAGRMTSHDSPADSRQNTRPAQTTAPSEASQSTDSSKTGPTQTLTGNVKNDEAKAANASTGTPASETASDSTIGTAPRIASDSPFKDEDSEEPVVAAGSEPLDEQSLREFGELGVLPGLFDDFSSVPDCDFDDALSTCQ